MRVAGRAPRFAILLVVAIGLLTGVTTATTAASAKTLSGGIGSGSASCSKMKGGLTFSPPLSNNPAPGTASLKLKAKAANCTGPTMTVTASMTSPDLSCSSFLSGDYSFSLEVKYSGKTDPSIVSFTSLSFSESPDVSITGNGGSVGGGSFTGDPATVAVATKLLGSTLEKVCHKGSPHWPIGSASLALTAA